MSAFTLDEIFKTRLETVFTRPQADVLIFPDKPDTYNLGHPIGAVLIHFHDRGFKQIGMTIAENEDIYEFRVVARKYGSDEGVREYLKKVEDCLKFFKPVAGGANLIPVRSKFLSYDKGIWQYYHLAKIKQS